MGALLGVIMLRLNMYVLSCLLADSAILLGIRRSLEVGYECLGRLCCPSGGDFECEFGLLVILSV